MIKWKLKKHDVDPEKVMSIFSVEKPMCDLLPLDDEQKNNPQVQLFGLFLDNATNVINPLILEK